jgi:hypothetical protein
MNVAICCAIIQKIANEAITLAGSPVLGQGDVADSPIAVPKVSRTNESAAASTAPAKTAPHSMKPGTAPVGTTLAAGAVRVGPSCVIGSISSHSESSAEAEDAEDEHDHNDQANKVDDAVHGVCSACIPHERIVRD